MNIRLVTSSAMLLALAGTSANAVSFNIDITILDSGLTVESPLDGSDVVTEAFSDRQKELIGVAGNFWESVVTGFFGLGDVVFPLTTGLAAGDGIGNTLAVGGPVAFETVGGINPATGLVDMYERATAGIAGFDTADFGARGVETERMFLDTSIHEFGHALGFGTMFDANGLLDATAGFYLGENAVGAYNITNGSAVPDILMEAGGGHWNECWVQLLSDATCDEALFDDPSLMTPYATEIATFTPATIAAFRDLGYLTVDPFSGVSLPDVDGNAVIPLPATGLLLLGGLFGIAATRGRHRRARVTEVR